MQHLLSYGCYAIAIIYIPEQKKMDYFLWTPTGTPSSGSNAVKPNPGGDLATTRPSLMLPNGESVLRARKLDFSDDVQCIFS